MEITKWEYIEISASDHNKINELGQQGWEAFGTSVSPNIGHITIYFKRPSGKIIVNEQGITSEVQKQEAVAVRKEESGKLNKTVSGCASYITPDFSELPEFSEMNLI